jgi:hypothetical protein
MTKPADLWPGNVFEPRPWSQEEWLKYACSRLCRTRSMIPIPGGGLFKGGPHTTLEEPAMSFKDYETC